MRYYLRFMTGLGFGLMNLILFHIAIKVKLGHQLSRSTCLKVVLATTLLAAVFRISLSLANQQFCFLGYYK